MGTVGTLVMSRTQTRSQSEQKEGRGMFLPSPHPTPRITRKLVQLPVMRLTCPPAGRAGPEFHSGNTTWTEDTPLRGILSPKTGS